MSETEAAASWWADYQQRLQQDQEEARRSLASVCAELTKLKITEVRIAYDGYGDSGAVEGVTATGALGDVELAEELRDRLIALAEHLLPAGFENNEGGFGELVLEVAERRMTREHNWRVESTEYEEEEWQL